MLTINKKMLIVFISVTTIIVLMVAAIFLATKQTTEKAETKEPDWSISNQADLVKNAFREYITQKKEETKEERKKRLQKYFTADSPVLGYETQEINSNSAESSLGEVVEMKECNVQEGEDLCLLLNTKIEYYVGRKKIKTVVTPYWITLDYVEGVGFRVYDLGVWEFGYDEDLT